VNVNLNLSTTDSVSGYEVYMSYNQALLNATGLQWGNLFPRDRVFNASICVNNVGTGCIGGLDNYNVVHLNVAYLDAPVHGSVSRTLFSIRFSPVPGVVGHSVFQFFNDTIWSDVQPPSNLPAPVIHQTWNGIYSNDGLQAFFNVATAIPIVGRPVSFDASSSFNSKDRSASYNAGLTYGWKFGDGKSGLGIKTSHSYSSTGSYPVSLTVNDTLGATSSISRPVVVVSALGTLQLYITDAVGNTLSQSVTVKLSNSSIVETITRPGGNTGPVTFSKLKAGTYQVDFSGPRITSASRQENVQEGWTTTDYVGLTVQTPDPNNLVLYLLLGTMASLPIIGAVLVVRRRALKRRARRAGRQSG
jgi:PKD repeat protein